MIRRIKEILPYRIYETIIKYLPEKLILEEIRIRFNRQAYIVASGRNLTIPIIATREEMDYILSIISKNSLYAFRDTILNGYISLGDGIRIGIIGRASIENGEVIGIYDISEFVIRIPNRISVSCKEIISLFLNDEFIPGILIYSPPGEGKTTILRSIIKELSRGKFNKRVCVIDTRNELAFGIEEKHLLVSILSGYPRKLGIEIAVRTMNAQILVCDEIGDERDSSAIIEAQGAGVPLIASCHGKSIFDALSHKGILDLHKMRIFEYYIGIKRKDAFEFEYTINNWREVDADL